MMLFPVAAALVMQATPAIPAGDGARTGRDGDVIVVTARRYEDRKTELAACIARGCPPDEEMIAWMRQADAQFLMGDYRGARGTVIKGRRRNAKYARQFPIQLSEMWRMDGKLASLNGQRAATRVAARGAADALRAGLAPDDPRIFVQRLEVGDGYALEPRIEAAEGIYRSVARDAAAAGRPSAEARAMLRLAILYAALARREQAYVATARRALAAIDVRTEPVFAPVREAAAVVRVRLDLALDRSADPARAMAALSHLPRSRDPVLIQAPALDTGLRGARSNTVQDYALAAQGGNGPIGTSIVRPDYDFEHQWADLSYRIAPDGTVQDLEVVRRGDANVDLWLKGVCDAVSRRRYVPFGTDRDDVGVYRIERFSLVADYSTDPGMRIPVRSGPPHIETTDLTTSRLGVDGPR